MSKQHSMAFRAKWGCMSWQSLVKTLRTRKFLRRWIILVAGYLWLLAPNAGQARGESQETRESLNTFMERYLGPPSDSENGLTRYVSALVDLRDDGKREAIIYITDADWCGSGGCTTLVLEPENSSYRIITEMTIVRLPIRVLKTKTNGWHDLGVWVQGGGIQPGYEAWLSFDGQTYPTNPSMAPDPPSKKRAPGKVVIARAR